jgi:hypothetical protein
MASSKKSAANVDSHVKSFALLKERLASLPEDETVAMNADLELAATAGSCLRSATGVPHRQRRMHRSGRVGSHRRGPVAAISGSWTGSSSGRLARCCRRHAGGHSAHHER